MKIGQVAKASGLSVQGVRFYEEAGLLSPAERTESGYRVFTHADLDRLDFIKKAKLLGLSLQEIKDILTINGRQQPTCVHVRLLLEQKVAEADRALQQLTEFRERLAQLLQQTEQLEDCRPSGGRICGIIEGFPSQEQPLGTRQTAPRKILGEIGRNGSKHDNL